MNRGLAPARRLAPAAVAALALALFVTACGADDAQSEPETTTASEPVDATAFKDCILSGDLQRGIYEEVPEPAPQFTQAADEAGAELFEAGKSDDGLVFFYIFADSTADETFTATLQGLIDQLADLLADEAPAGGLGEGSVQTEGPVVFGLLPFSEKKTVELGEETAADVSSCLADLQ